MLPSGADAITVRSHSQPPRFQTSGLFNADHYGNVPKWVPAMHYGTWDKLWQQVIHKWYLLGQIWPALGHLGSCLGLRPLSVKYWLLWQRSKMTSCNASWDLRQPVTTTTTRPQTIHPRADGTSVGPPRQPPRAQTSEGVMLTLH